MSDVLERPAASILNSDVQLALYERMLQLRAFEKRAYDLFLQNLVKGTSHLGLGQEAIATGFSHAMRPDDWTFATYRGHNHTLARGADAGATMAELLGRVNGLLHGKGGSMHLTDAEHGVMGSYAIIGAHLTIAVGAAWSAKIRGTTQVAVCFFGDGATNIGAFHEALNLAVVWKLPVVFVCENNLYMEYTPIASVTAVEHPAADRAAGYGLPSIIIDGNDVELCYATALAAYDRARNGGGPSLIEAKTYRHGGHSRADAATYRPKEEVEAWLLRDPLLLYKAQLLENDVTSAQLDTIEARTRSWIDRATEDAKQGAAPGPEFLMTNVWADGGSEWRN